MPLQNLFLDTDSLRIGANQFYTQSNAVFVGNNLHVGNTILLGLIAGNAAVGTPVNFYPNSTKLIIAANNPLWSGFGGGAIDLRVGTAGGRVGITFSSNINFASDGAYMYYNDSLPGYTAVSGSETSVFLLGTWNDSSSSPSNEDILALESAGNIFLNPGMGTSITPGGTTSWSNTQGNLWVGNNSIKYLAIHEGLQANVTLRAPITFANSANALVFSGASNTSITLRTSPNGILSFDGGAGSLLSISNNILGQIFSVNDISGFPVLEVTANTVPSNTFIQMGQFGSKVSIGTNTTSTSRLTISSNSTVNALEIQGNVGSNTGYFKTPSGTFFSQNGAGELVILALGQLRFSDSSLWSYDAWGGIRYVSANNTMIIGGPGAPGISNNVVVSANIVMHNATTGNFMVANTAATNLFVGANGNVGIGNNTPGSKLVAEISDNGFLPAAVIRNVNTGGSAQAILDLVSDDGSFRLFRSSTAGGLGAGLYVSTADPIVMYTNTVSRVFVSANGNVGIGNTTPTSRLIVGGSSAALARSNTTYGTYYESEGITVSQANDTVNNLSYLDFRAAGGNAAAALIVINEAHTGSAATGSLTFATASASAVPSERMRIAANGNVGIGNAAPAAALQVTSTVTVQQGATIARFGTSASSERIRIIDENATGSLPPMITCPSASYGIGIAADQGAAAPVIFYTGTANTTNERMRINNTGVGIGNNAPADKLSVNGTVQFTNSSASVFLAAANGNVGIGTTSPTEKLYVSGSYIFQRNNADAAGGIVLDSGTSATQFGQIIFRDQGTDKWYIRKTTSNNFDLYNSNTTSVALTISSANNNVGIGNAAPNAKLQVTGTANISGNVALGGDLTVAGNLTISGTTTYINTTTLNIGDNIITLNADLGAVAPSENAGIEVNRGSSANVTFLWDETNDYWAQGNTNITGFANVSTSVNSALLTVGTDFIANTTGAYHTGTVNAASHTVSTSFIANSTGVTTTGFVNATSSVNSALLTVGTSFIANTTGAYHTGTINAASHTVGTSFIANTTGVYHTGTVNAASHTISTGEFTANTIGITTAGFVNASSYAAACNQFVANSTGITTTGFANVGTTISIGANVIANTTAVFVGNSTVNTVITQNTLRVANATGTSLLVAANGNIGIGNSTPGYPLSVTGAINANSYNVGGTAFINSDRTIKYYGTTHNQLGSGSGTRDIDLTLGNFISATVAGTTTWTFSNPIAGSAVTGFILELTNGGSAALTWPASVKWPGGTAPTLTAAGIDVLTFFTDDGGTTYRGVLSMLDSK